MNYCLDNCDNIPFSDASLLEEIWESWERTQEKGRKRGSGTTEAGWWIQRGNSDC